ncbi:hypothetical protein T03_13048 [Trichinella britovi]|uniref:Uncharacterized protein n=1 Tax=Trichinella britovi TaxID=45882 RepID=A0A0V1D8N5_TRIBR|nr:hypothetical protein T03_13048 [Trichinella britovi]
MIFAQCTASSDPVMWQWLLVQLKKRVASNLSTSNEEDNKFNREVESEFFCEDGDIEGVTLFTISHDIKFYYATVRNHTRKKRQRVSTAQSNNNSLELLEYHVHAGGTVVAYMPAHHIVTLPLPLVRSVPRPPTLVIPLKIIEASVFRVALPTKMDANEPEAISVGSLRNDSP